MHRLPELFHHTMNELQAVHGFLELGEIEKAKLEMKEVFKMMRRMRRILDGMDIPETKKKKNAGKI